MDIFEMKKSDFKEVPRFNWDHPKIDFDDIVIIPTPYKHDSGYRCMEYCACENGEPIGIFGGGSDIMNLDDIGGYGEWSSTLPTTFDKKPWRIDCLPCGYLHLWCGGYSLRAGGCLSDFELFTVKRHG